MDLPSKCLREKESRFLVQFADTFAGTHHCGGPTSTQALRMLLIVSTVRGVSHMHWWRIACVLFQNVRSVFVAENLLGEHTIDPPQAACWLSVDRYGAQRRHSKNTVLSLSQLLVFCLYWFMPPHMTNGWTERSFVLPHHSVVLPLAKRPQPSHALKQWTKTSALLRSAHLLKTSTTPRKQQLPRKHSLGPEHKKTFRRAQRPPQKITCANFVPTLRIAD